MRRSIVRRSASRAGKLVLPGALAVAAVLASVGAALAAGNSSTIPVAAKNSALAATVPASFRQNGIVIAMDATYAPDEFVAANGHTIVGMDADLAHAIGQVLGLKVTLVNATFDTIIPALVSAKYDVGMSSFTVTAAREKVVDFVTYFTAGEGYYVLANSHLKVNGLSALCGRTVAVESGTTEQSDATTQAKACVASKKPTVAVLPFDTQNGANLAVSSGRAQVGFADSRVAAYIVTQSHGVFANSGNAFETAPYGIAFPKKQGLTKPFQAAIKALIHDGIYTKIMDKWGIDAGAITNPTINPKVS